MSQIEIKCYGEEQGIQGCPACPLSPDWLQFMRGKGLNEQCRPKLERMYGKERVDQAASGDKLINPDLIIGSE